jgi:hypothetical protein
MPIICWTHAHFWLCHCQFRLLWYKLFNRYKIPQLCFKTWWILIFYFIDLEWITVLQLCFKKDFYIVWIQFSDLWNNYQTSSYGNWNYLKTWDICNERFGFEIFLNKLQAIIWNIWQLKKINHALHMHKVLFFILCFLFPFLPEQLNQSWELF